MLLVDLLRIGRRRNSINFSLALTMSYMQRYVLICCPLLLYLISIVCIKHVFRKKSLGVLLKIEQTRRKSMRLLYKLHDPRLVLPVPINQNCIVMFVSDRVMMTILVSKRMDIRISGKIGTVESKAVHGPMHNHLLWLLRLLLVVDPKPWLPRSWLPMVWLVGGPIQWPPLMGPLAFLCLT